jgi:hypothetical protein
MDIELKRIKLIADFVILSKVLDEFYNKSIGTTTEQKIIDLRALFVDSVKMVNILDLDKKASEKSLLKEKELNLKLIVDMNRLKLEQESEIVSIKFDYENRIKELEDNLRMYI